MSDKFTKFTTEPTPTYLDKNGNWISRDDTLFSGGGFSTARSTPATITEPIVTPKGREAIKSLIPPETRERVGAIVESARQRSFAPLRESFQREGEQFQQEMQAVIEGKLTIPETQVARMAEGGAAGFLGGLRKVGGEVIKQAGKRIERGFVTSVKKEFPEIQRVAGQYIPRSTDRLAIKARTLIKEDIETATRIATNETDENAVALSAELIKHYSDQAAKATDTATKSALYDRAAEIANTAAKNLTEQGRAVQAASILGRLTPEGQIKFAAREIQKYNEAIDQGRGGIFGLRRKIPELTGQQADEIVTEMRAINSLLDGEEKAIRFQALQKRISDLVPSSLYQKVVAVWKAGLLTGLKTSGLNIFANVSHGILEVAKDIPAVAVDRVASLFTGKRTVSFTTRGLGGGLVEGLSKGWRYLKTGFDERNIGIKLDYRNVNFGKGRIAKGLQRYEEAVFRVLGSEDQPFYYGAKARSLANQAIAQGKNRGLRGSELQKFVNELIQNPTDEMARYAVLDAEIAVFQNKTAFGDAARKIQQIKGGEFIVPFGRTPSAVAMQIINYSPIGIVKTIIENIGRGRFDQRLFAQGIGRGLTGIGILFIGTKLSQKGLVTLDRPTTERERELWSLEGRKANSIKIGNEWRSIQVLGPAGNLLLIGGHLQRAFDESGSPTQAMMTAAIGTVKSFFEQTFLTGINQVVNALNDPARSAEGYFGSVLSSTVPTLVKDIGQAGDPLERRSETILERIQARLPGIRQKLEPQIDVLGRERKRVGNVLETIADPTRPSKDISTPVVVELRRLFDAGYKVTPTKLGDKEGFPALTQEQNTKLWKRAGEITEAKLTALIQRDAYRKLPDELKAKKVGEFVEKSKLMARVEKVLELTEGLHGEELKKKLSELKKGKLLAREVFTKFMELR